MSTAALHKLLLLGRSSQDELATQIQYLTVENRILRSKLPRCVNLTQRERRRLLRFGSAVGPGLRHIITIVHYTTFRRWVRGAVGRRRRQKRTKIGRPPTSNELKRLVVRMARTPGWGYTRILGELRKLGITSISRTTVRAILKEHGIEPSPERSEPTWHQFLRRHAATLWSCDFCTKNVVTPTGLRSYTLLVLLHVASRKVVVAQATAHPDTDWVTRVAECLPVMARQLGLDSPEILIRDNDAKFSREFDRALRCEGVSPCALPVQAPLLNAHVERWIKSLKVECLDHFIPVGVKHLDYLVAQYVEHYHAERPHQGLGNRPIMEQPPSSEGAIRCHTRLGGLLRHYHRAA